MMRGRLIDTQGSAGAALPLRDHCPHCLGLGWIERPGSAYYSDAVSHRPVLDVVLSPCLRCRTSGVILDSSAPEHVENLTVSEPLTVGIVETTA